jgi:hypothetical protein
LTSAEPNPLIISNIRAKYYFIRIEASPSHSRLIDFGI